MGLAGHVPARDVADRNRGTSKEAINEAFTKSDVVCYGNIRGECDIAPSVSANAACESDAATTGYAGPTTKEHPGEGQGQG